MFDVLEWAAASVLAYRPPPLRRKEFAVPDFSAGTIRSLTSVDFLDRRADHAGREPKR
ncbi:hypothetical protein [Nocardia ninae]|uniref:hypothetical protein n=1 Tax=Nocardia ninae TaxID=356145 RepID=UPI0016498B94|nr:hypothetical protein [Nocardia ninae]